MCEHFTFNRSFQLYTYTQCLSRSSILERYLTAMLRFRPSLLLPTIDSITTSVVRTGSPRGRSNILREKSVIWRRLRPLGTTCPSLRCLPPPDRLGRCFHFEGAQTCPTSMIAILNKHVPVRFVYNICPSIKTLIGAGHVNFIISTPNCTALHRTNCCSTAVITQLGIYGSLLLKTVYCLTIHFCLKVILIHDRRTHLEPIIRLQSRSRSSTVADKLNVRARFVDLDDFLFLHVFVTLLLLMYGTSTAQWAIGGEISGTSKALNLPRPSLVLRQERQPRVILITRTETLSLSLTPPADVELSRIQESERTPVVLDVDA